MKAPIEIMHFIRSVILSNGADRTLKAEALEIYMRHMGTFGIVDENGVEIARIVGRPARQIEQFLATGNKLKAIKLLRTCTGLGLKEAKDAIENPQNFKQPVKPDRPA